jgi:DNA (cytosine-5)-methyltransferase 1
VTILAIARDYGDDQLHGLMQALGMSTAKDSSAGERLASSELGLVLAGKTLGTRRRGSKPGDNTESAFLNLASIARNNDGACNRAIGMGLVDIGLVQSTQTEKALGTSLTYYSDLYAVTPAARIRIEVMWRSKTSRAEIANYVLGKLGNYGRAIGLLT